MAALDGDAEGDGRGVPKRGRYGYINRALPDDESKRSWIHWPAASRHLKNTSSNAGPTEAQLRSFSGRECEHHAQETPDQQREGVRKRRDLRTKKGEFVGIERSTVLGMTSRDLCKSSKGLVGAPGLEPGTR